MKEYEPCSEVNAIENTYPGFYDYQRSAEAGPVKKALAHYLIPKTMRKVSNGIHV